MITQYPVTLTSKKTLSSNTIQLGFTLSDSDKALFLLHPVSLSN